MFSKNQGVIVYYVRTLSFWG